VVRKVLVCVLTAALNATLAAACGRGPEHPVAPPTAIPTQSATPTAAGPSPAPTANALRSPLTGLPVRRLAPVLAVKIDNTRRAHPQAGLTAADVVYVEQVEGGLTRLLAVFSSRLPRILGPVRSARVSDPELLRPYGPVALRTPVLTARSCPYCERRRSACSATTTAAAVTGGSAATGRRTTCSLTPERCSPARPRPLPRGTSGSASDRHRQVGAGSPAHVPSTPPRE
jgi:hypothetical protein